MQPPNSFCHKLATLVPAGVCVLEAAPDEVVASTEGGVVVGMMVVVVLTSQLVGVALNIR